MGQKHISLWKSAMVYGFYLAVALILASVIFYATGNIFTKANQYVSYLIMILGIVLVQINYRKSIGGAMPYGQALGIAVVTMVLAGVIAAVYTYLLYEIIDPGLKEQLRIYTEEQMMEKGMPEAQLETAIAITRKFQKPVVMAISAIFSYAVIGLVVGLITSIFTKKGSIATEG
ncbi:hypothetical protein MNBD_BACTEROID01-1344 [hydrothermal vent metagenome]|uniref:DUF4199 domain-containing protein n=1 Tax=hydrothermal vent metagenome TaxID=652676 RepID=A0A3B0T319_9ZZZZ